ncbi:MAG: phosphoenolpyruvate--protein phosphotransferase [Thermoanaerobaculia bacterium]|nr:phosphoenolpyruvate--protein phosphotransferase [Thermoanaerobaculia bacterium]
MEIFHGTGVSPGIGIGRSVSIESLPSEIYRISLAESELGPEIERFRASLVDAEREIQGTAAEVRRKLGDDLAAIFEAHSLLLKDQDFIERIVQQIKSEKINAEWAIHRVVTDLAERFQAMETPHLRDKVEDLRDVGRYVLRCLQGSTTHDLSELGSDVVVIAHDLTPSEAVRLGRSRVVGFVLESGGATSHTAIIARSLNTPLVVGLEGIGKRITDDDPVVVDGKEGKVILHPTDEVLERYRALAGQMKARDSEMQATRELEAVTLDGTSIDLAANIELPEELADAQRFGARGVGLYRSEFLYIEKSPELPTEEEHLEIYRRMLAEMAPHPVVIRTYDLGGRKLARELLATHEDNPVLGLRGIRLTMARPTIFRVQLRALLRAGVDGELRIMLPMVSGVEEVRKFRHGLLRLMKELDAEGVRYAGDPELGIMIEVPSAALTADVLAREVDFFSIGTNDLIQYALAVDRNNEHVAHLHQPHHPAILRMIRFVVDSAAEAGIDVSLCGEMASDVRSTALLVGLGLRRLSMAPRQVPAVKSRVRQIDRADAEEAAKRCLTMGTAQEVDDHLRTVFGAALVSA